MTDPDDKKLLNYPRLDDKARLLPEIKETEEEGEEPKSPMECYIFNPRLKKEFNDGKCEHCKKYLTTSCPYINEFIDEVEDMEPE